MSTFGKSLEARSTSVDAVSFPLTGRPVVPFWLFGLRVWMQGLLLTNPLTAASSTCLATTSTSDIVVVVVVVVVVLVVVVVVVVVVKPSP